MPDEHSKAACGSVFILSQPDYDYEKIDSVWTDEASALARGAELGYGFLSEYRLNSPDALLRKGWVPPGDPPVWSDWGGTRV